MEKRPRLFHAPHLTSNFEIRRQCVKTFSLRTSLIVLSTIIACLFLTPPLNAQSQSHTFVAYGPAGFSRGTGIPAPVNATFNVLDPSTTFTMRIDCTTVTSAIVTLNGV